MKALIVITLMSVLPLLLCGQDTLRTGTFVVRKVYEGNFIPDGLGFLGNMGGVNADIVPGANNQDNLTISGRAVTLYKGDSTPVRSAIIEVVGTKFTSNTANDGRFSLSLPKTLKTPGDTLMLRLTHISGWDTTMVVNLVDKEREYIFSRTIATKQQMSRRERRREMLKRIFYPWKWFQKKEKLPPRGTIKNGS